jgi:hypothetical protein
MKYFLFSALFFLAGCASYYKGLTSEALISCADEIKPTNLNTTWYTASIDVIGKHLSGLLVVKKMPDASYRLVFTNEAGATFFDFKFQPDGSFQVVSVITQLDKKPVIGTLSKDFELMLGLPFNQLLLSWQHNSLKYAGIERDGEKIYFIVNPDCASHGNLEIGSNRKRKVSVSLSGKEPTQPDSILITHYTFDMTIRLTKFDKDVDE